MTLDRDDVRIARRLLSNRNGWRDNEPVIEYQREFAKWNGSEFAFAFMGGRVALSACIHALGLGEGDEVILPGYTCVVVPNAFHYARVRPVYCDIELETFGLDANSVEAAITPRTRAVLLHHLYGQVCRDFDALLAIAESHGLAVIEDCAHATGATYRGVKVGNQGLLGFYSSEQSKVMNTIQGGIAVTNDPAIAQKLQAYWASAPEPDDEFIDRLLHNVLLNYYGQKHPQRWWLGDVMDILHGDKELISTTCEEEQGIKPLHYGARMPAAVARLGLNQLRKVDEYNNLRRQTARRWDDWCKRAGYRPATVIPESTPVFLRYPVLVEPERKVDRSWAERELGVRPGEWYSSNIHPVPGNLPCCPRADDAVASVVNLPCLLK
jgi:dTDP-4-amino-4,6-dideoxygalactose transaminase